MTAREIQKRLKRLANKSRAEVSQRFFKTGKGEYGEGDIFIGLTVPQIRQLAKEFRDLPEKEIERLLHSKNHEERQLALFILVRLFQRGDDATKRRLYQFYLANTRHINNWDLVDGSAEHIVGAFLRGKNCAPFQRLAQSSNLWERRIAIISTYHYIKRGEFSETLKIAKLLLHDEEDLIHKAVGWMLREVGKRDLAAEEKFLRAHYQKMPRTMLRYAIEKLPETKRQRYLRGKM